MLPAEGSQVLLPFASLQSNTSYMTKKEVEVKNTAHASSLGTHMFSMQEQGDLLKRASKT